MKKAVCFSLAFIAAVFAAAVLLLFFEPEILRLVELVKALLSTIFEQIEALPLWAYPLACFLLPIFVLPITPVYFAAGASGENILFVIFLCYVGVVFNMAFSYFISRKFADFARKVLSRRGIEIPNISKKSGADFVFLVRMIPGNPLCVQNYLLGLSGVDFKKYMAISMIIQAFHVSGYIYFSEGIVRGDFASLIFGASLICVFIAAARILKRRKQYGISEIER